MVHPSAKVAVSVRVGPIVQFLADLRST